jgi:hypothetical protein
MFPLLYVLACGDSAVQTRQDEVPTQDDRVLALDTTAVPRPGGITYTLSLDGAEIVLELDDPKVKQPPFAHGEAVLRARDPENGARFVAAVVRWLGEADPPVGNGHPGPWNLRYSLMTETPRWSVYKMVLEDETGQADLILRTRTEHPSVEILKREDTSEEDLARLLAVVLRDGPDIDAWIPRSTALRGSEGLTTVAWCGDGLVGLARTEGGFSMRRWTDLRGQPEVVFSATGRPRQLLPNPTCTRAAVAVDYPSDPEAYNSADPTEIAWVDLTTKAVSILSGRDETWSLQDAQWSPDGVHLALTTVHQALTPPFPSVTRVYEVGGDDRYTGDPSWDAVPWAWTDDGLLLRTDPFNRREDQPSWYRWSLTSVATASKPPPLTSPDSTTTLNASHLEGFDPFLARWIGPHHVLWVDSEAQVRDLSDGSDRPLHTLGGVQALAIDATGSRVALLTDVGVRWASTTK